MTYITVKHTVTVRVDLEAFAAEFGTTIDTVEDRKDNEADARQYVADALRYTATAGLDHIDAIVATVD